MPHATLSCAKEIKPCEAEMLRYAQHHVCDVITRICR